MYYDTQKMDAAISVADLTKIYKLYDRPSNRLKELFLKKPLHKEFLALDKVTFDLPRGGNLGIIGENGAGKSTLLKIIAGTLSKTSGDVRVNGRVSSLLELGSGFHPEFTGMENIYFYGALLGLSRSELSSKIEEIVDFAEIGDFINYPLKTYSSGMFVRLAFSVATAVDPDILVVDEALSVGDLYFQKKSINKIISFKKQGKTIIFCSHAIYYINQLCENVLWLKNGRVEMLGPHYDVTQAYENYQLEKKSDSNDVRQDEISEDISDKPVIIKEVKTFPFPNLRTGDSLKIKISTLSKNDLCQFKLAIILKRIDGLDITSTYTSDTKLLRGNLEVNVEFPALQLKAGTYFIRSFLLDEHMLHIYDTKDSLPFNIPKESIEVGIVDLPCKWII
ncbi:MAG: ABC transporter ATP-binding protein [Nitrospirota bacterium]